MKDESRGEKGANYRECLCNSDFLSGTRNNGGRGRQDTKTDNLHPQWLHIYTYDHHDSSQLHNKKLSSKQIVHTYIHTIGAVIPQCKNIILIYSLTFAILCSSNHLPVHDLVSAATFGRRKMICLVVQLLLLLTCSSFLWMFSLASISAMAGVAPTCSRRIPLSW